MNKFIKSILYCLAIIVLCWSCQSKEKVKSNSDLITKIDSQIQEGDIIFHTSTSRQSIAIQKATDSQYSHMGIIFKKDDEWYVYEAIQPVQYTALRVWIYRGENSHFIVKRLKDNKELLKTEQIEKMKKQALLYLGKNYDALFGWSDDRIYCSELVWKIYKESLGIEIGKLQQLEEFDLSHPIVKDKMKERYGIDIPWKEVVISPERMFLSDQLITIENPTF